VSLREAPLSDPLAYVSASAGDAWLGIVNEEPSRALALVALKPRNGVFR
jgi:hypothetical protein